MISQIMQRIVFFKYKYRMRIRFKNKYLFFIIIKMKRIDLQQIYS